MIRKVIVLTKNIKVIGKNAKQMRINNGYTLNNVADFLGVDQSLMAKFEAGGCSMQIDLLEKLSTLYGYKFSDLQKAEIPRKRHINSAFQAGKLSPDDLKAIYHTNRIALNSFFMTELLDG